MTYRVIVEKRGMYWVRNMETMRDYQWYSSRREAEQVAKELNTVRKVG